MDRIGCEKKEEFYSVIINELKLLGIKFRKEKKQKIVEDKKCRNRIFRVQLHFLELTDVILASGSVVQIPTFLANACNRILEQVEIEGIFRKAGSSIRQREIRVSLENGAPLGRAHHVIDIANIVKYFFRELPEPLIASSIQDTLLRCLQISGPNRKKTMLLACLLMPSLTLHTLTFFMQFLKTVACSVAQNRMSIENLAIIFTPALMPFSDIKCQRFNNHVHVVQLLIENANMIGIVPDYITDKINYQAHLNMDMDDYESRQKRKKKRRSDMFNGFKKIVGSAIGSSENLENTPDTKLVEATTHNKVDWPQTHQHASTPHLLKSSKKRKFAEPAACTFSAKKKKDLLPILPSNSCGIMPNDIQTKALKKSRMSLGGNRIKNMVPCTTNPLIASMERRWSIVGGTGWTRKNKTPYDSKLIAASSSEDMEQFKPNDFEINIKKDVHNECIPKQCIQTKTEDNYAQTSDNDSFVITKNDYEEIKERMKEIEVRLSQEFRNHQKQHNLTLGWNPTTDDDSYKHILSGPERVQNKYEQIIVETETLNSPNTEQLAQRLSRGLKIRRSIDQQIIRSPSARKIGTIRRRSQERKRVSRTLTWHVSTVVKPPPTAAVVACNTDASSSLIQSRKPDSEVVPKAGYYSPLPSKINLKRGRPNTVQSGLILHNALPHTPLTSSSTLHQQKFEKNIMMHINVPEEESSAINENWISGELFFKNASEAQSNTDLFTPIRSKVCKENNSNDTMLTPMCPPKSIPRRMHGSSSAMKPLSISKHLSGPHSRLTPLLDESNGRASIARLLSQNAGMVMAKAKLFDGLGERDKHLPGWIPQNNAAKIPRVSLNIGESSKRIMMTERETMNVKRKKNYH